MADTAQGDEEPPGVWIDTDQGRWRQGYLPGCSPSELDGPVRAEVYKAVVLLRSAIRQFGLTRREALHAIEQALKELGKS